MFPSWWSRERYRRGYFLLASELLLQPSPQRPKLVIQRLEPQLRAELLMAFLGLVLIGLALVVLVILWAHHVRRLARMRNQAGTETEDRWYAKPLAAGNDRASNQPGDTP